MTTTMSDDMAAFTGAAIRQAIAKARVEGIAEGERRATAAIVELLGENFDAAEFEERDFPQWLTAADAALTAARPVIERETLHGYMAALAIDYFAKCCCAAAAIRSQP